MAENAPYEEEEQLEDGVSEEVLGLILLGIVEGVDTVIMSRWADSDFDEVQRTMRGVVSRALPTMNTASRDAIQVGIDRAKRQLSGLSGITFDYSNEVIQRHIQAVFESHMAQVEETNDRAYRRLVEIASERGWTNQELARRVKKYFGLVPSHIMTVLNMESALLAEGASRKIVDTQVQKKIDQLIDWRAKLIADNIAVDVVEGSKAEAFAYLYNIGKLSNDYVKQWVSVIDDRTSDICMSSNRSIAEVNQPFQNGFMYPPAHGHCRSSIRLIKRPS